jgi:uncharacterized protein (TIGR03437 family)
MLQRLFVAALLVTAVGLNGQVPSVPAGGVVNGGSFRPADAGGAVAPGGIASVFGSNLAIGIAFAPSTPLPLVLNGTSVTVDGTNAALFYVSPNQINFQVPWSVAAGLRPVVVRNAAGQSQAVNVLVNLSAGGIFAQASNGRGPGAIQTFVGQGNTPLNTFTTAAAPGGVIIVYASNLGAVQNTPGVGEVGNGNPVQGAVTATVGGVAATVEFAGLVPGFVSLYQVNLRLPANIPQGCFLPVQVFVNGAPSNMVTIAVANGGNCNNVSSSVPGGAANSTVAVATLTRATVNLNLGLPFPVPPTVTGTFAATAQRVGVGGSASGYAFPPPSGGCLVDVFRVDDLSSSNPPLAGTTTPINVTPLNLGTLTLTGPGVNRTINPSAPGVYSAPSAADTSALNVTAGSWNLRSSGGDVPAFNVTLNYQTLNVTSSGVPANNVLLRSQNLTSTWACQDPGGQVILQVVSMDSAKKVFGYALCTAACSANSITVPASLLNQLPPSGVTSGVGEGFLFLLFIPNIANAPRIPGVDYGFFLGTDATAYGGITIQ